MEGLYKGFKKISEDENKALLKHDNGHELRIAKSGLSKKHLKALQKLPLYQAEGTQEPEGDRQLASDIGMVAQPVMEETQMPSKEAKAALAPPVDPTEGLEPLPQEEPQRQPTEQAMPAEQPQVSVAAPKKAMTPQEVMASPTTKASDKLLAASNLFQGIQNRMKEADDRFQTEMSKAPQTVPKMLSGQGFLGGLARVLGFVIGGGAQGVLGLKENPAVTMFNDQINREIEAQRHEETKKFNLYKMHMARLGDEAQAALQTGVNLRQIADQQFNEMMGKSGLGPMAQQNLQVLKAQNLLALEQTRAALANTKMQKQIQQSLMSGQPMEQTDPAVLVPYRVPKEHQEAVYKEVERAQDTRRMGDAILKAFDNAANENTVLKTGAGLLRTPPSVLTLHQAMQPTFKDLEGTVRQAAMDNTFKNITPAPGDLGSTVAIKREALKDYLRSKASAPRAKSFGIDLDKFKSTAPPAEVKTMNGVKYQKVEGGWKRVQ